MEYWQGPEWEHMILAYVPESEYLDYSDAVGLAIIRDAQAADQLVQDWEACCAR